ncbi:hypothetical protein BZA05DRAFT_105501 [Tricharina praecox]|uniref:uncharacterized protein n=1 Tax=Tricharina praecox TaxID=43433 RepID=UPI00221EED70|nr:uncharacterized protein BZA05DRAFT_105501 [Tricharina praecox]KAI5857766.1 hypothetical protein BZA05DRAFT_105501 [Tricharina praecox]
MHPEHWYNNLGGEGEDDAESLDGEGNVELDLETPMKSKFTVSSRLDCSDNKLTEISLVNEDFLPAQTIMNADDNGNGVFGNTLKMRQFQYLKAIQIAKENDEKGNHGFNIKWDEHPSTIISALEDCGAAPTLSDDRMNETSTRKAFDPKAPHFDVIVINLLESPYFPKDTVVPEGGLRPTLMDDLPISSLLGRPGFIIMHIGGTALGREEGMRLFDVWKIKTLETITWLPKVIETLHANQRGHGVLSSSSEDFLVGLKGNINRSKDSNIVHCNVSGDVMVSSQRPQMEFLAEKFSNGQRRLSIFVPSGAPRPGWVQMGRDLCNNFDCREWLQKWQGKDSWLLKITDDIEYFRPKSPSDTGSNGQGDFLEDIDEIIRRTRSKRT